MATVNPVKKLRGTASQNAAVTLDAGTIVYVTDHKVLAVHDGSTAGGTIINAGAWELIQDYSFTTNTSTIDFTGLGDFKFLRFTLRLKTMSGNNKLLVRFSADSGSAWYSGSSDYRHGGLWNTATAADGYQDTTESYINIAGDVDDYVAVTLVVSFLHSNAEKTTVNAHGVVDGVSVVNAVGAHNTAVAKNAVRLYGTGNYDEGTVIVEGVRA